jgi:hypothetical protein
MGQCEDASDGVWDSSIRSLLTSGYCDRHPVIAALAAKAQAGGFRCLTRTQQETLSSAFVASQGMKVARRRPR